MSETALILYATPESLSCAKLRIALRCKGVAWRELAPEGGCGAAAFRAVVPSGTLPAIDDAGFVLAESEAIAEWLEETQGPPSMLPGDARARAVQRMLSRFHDTRLEPAVRALFPLVGRGGDAAAALALIAERLAQFAALARPAPLLGGESLSLADCGYPVTFAWIDLLAETVGGAVAWPEALGGYRAALAAHPAVAAEMAAYRPAMAAWVAGRRTG